jgi:hypothetical protein
MPSDDRLIRSLGSALAPDDRPLDAQRVDALRTHILASPRPKPRAMRRAAVVLAVLAALAGGTVLGHELPRPVREVAIWLNLPVDSPELVDARAEMQRLGRALAGENAREVIAADRAMLSLVKKLDEKEKGEIVPVAHEVHERACSFLRERAIAPPDTCPPKS